MIAEKCAFVFPGQGSQAVGMGYHLAKTYPLAAQVFQQADEILGFHLSSLAWEGPEAELNDTANTQPALFVHSVAVWRVFQEKVPHWQPNFVAGHSMGELSALVAAGAIDYAEGLRLVRQRGELMKSAGEQSPGAMAAILGLDSATLEHICAQASQGEEVVQVANDNCPGQVVISGAKPALERAILLAQIAGARRVRLLAVSIAAHSPLMQHAQQDFQRAVQAAPLREASIPVVGNVSATPLTTAEELRHDLQAQLTSRVRWVESVQAMVQNGVTTFFELGSGEVLCGLIRRIAANVICYALGEPQDFSQLAP